MLDYSVYSAHSFTDHNDYFILASSLYTKPLKVENDAHCYLPFMPGGYTWYFGLRGYTRSMTLGATLGNVVKTSMPDGVSKGTYYTDTFTWSDEGVFSAHDFGVFEGMSYSGKIFFDAEYITVANLSDTSSATLMASFDAPRSGSSSSKTGYYANSASMEECNLPLHVVFKLSSDDWKKGYDSVNLVFEGSIQEGEAVKDSSYHDHQTWDRYPRIDLLATKNFKLEIRKPNPPMHSTVHQRNYAFPKAPEEGIKGAAAVKILSETNWQLLVESTAEDWLIISGDKTSGNATGPEGEWVIFTAKENTTGQNRFAKLTLVSSPYDNKSKTEVTIVDVFQAGQ